MLTEGSTHSFAVQLRYGGVACCWPGYDNDGTCREQPAGRSGECHN